MRSASFISSSFSTGVHLQYTTSTVTHPHLLCSFYITPQTQTFQSPTTHLRWWICWCLLIWCEHSITDGAVFNVDWWWRWFSVSVRPFRLYNAILVVTFPQMMDNLNVFWGSLCILSKFYQVFYYFFPLCVYSGLFEWRHQAGVQCGRREWDHYGGLSVQEG